MLNQHKREPRLGRNVLEEFGKRLESSGGGPESDDRVTSLLQLIALRIGRRRGRWGRAGFLASYYASRLVVVSRHRALLAVTLHFHLKPGRGRRRIRTSAIVEVGQDCILQADFQSASVRFV